MSAPTQNDLILARLQETPGEWVAMPELCEVAESLNCHTRINDLRDAGHNIENYQEHQKGTRRRKSYYRLILPDPPPVQQFIKFTNGSSIFVGSSAPVSTVGH